MDGAFQNKCFGLPDDFDCDSCHYNVTCFDNMWDNDDLTHCDNCGIWFENKLIHEEIIGDHCFAPCPKCDRDIIDGMTREELLDEENPSFAATFAYDDGDNATYLFPTEEKRIVFIDQRIRDLKEDGVYLGSASIHPDEIIVITEDANKEKHRMQIIKSNIYR